MRPELVTLAEAKLFCRVDHDDEDTVFAMLIGAATESVLDLADSWQSGDDVPDRMKLAVLAHVARAYSDREDGADAPASASRLLGPLRSLDI